MSKRSKVKSEPKTEPEALEGWKEIAEFLGEPTSVVKRWAGEGMPVETEGRFVTTTPAKLNAWLTHESGKPVQVVNPEADLTSELKRGIEFFRKKKRSAR